MTPRVGLILLAAGGATRMGRPKQLLLYQGRTLLRRAAEAAIDADLAPVVVVLGAHAQETAQELRGLAVLAVENADWQRGPGSSIRAGMAALEKTVIPGNHSSASNLAVSGSGGGELSGVILMLCDQPLVIPAVLRRLVEAHRQTGTTITASAYDGTLGVPALFDRQWFPQLAALGDAEGAKRLIAQAPGSGVDSIPFPGGGVDLDTPEDYARFLSA